MTWVNASAGLTNHGQRGTQESTRAPVDSVERARLRRDVGAVLRRERLVHGLTQRRLAELSGYSVAMIGDAERGRMRLSESSTRRLAEALRPGADPVAVAALDLELQRAAGPSLRRWNRRPHGAKRARVYAAARARLDGSTPSPSPERVAVGRALAALADPWRPPL